MEYLIENPQTDLEKYKQANEIIHKLISFLMHTTVPFNGFDMKRFSDGKICATLRGYHFGLDGDDSDLWFMFDEMDFTISGAVTKFKTSGACAIIIHCLETIPKTADDCYQLAKEIIHDNMIHKVLLHELIHYLDNKTQKFIGDRKPTDAYYNYGPEYYNDPHEFNAYFNNIADPFLRAIHLAELNTASGIRYSKGAGISKDFKKTLQTIIKNISARDIPLQKFIKHLSPERKKAFISRMYRLWKHLSELIDLPD